MYEILCSYNEKAVAPKICMAIMKRLVGLKYSIELVDLDNDMRLWKIHQSK